MFGPQVFDAARAIEPSARGELEITDTIQRLIDDGSRVESRPRARLVEGHRPARGHARGQPPRARGHRAPHRRRARGLARRGPGRDRGGRAARALDRPRARRSSAPARRVTDAYIGPYTAIARDCVVSGSEIEHSILLAGSEVRDLGARMEASLLGRNAKLAPRRRPAEDAADDRRRQLGDHDPVRVLVTGAGGMLGRDVVRALRAARPRVARRSRAPSSTSPTAPPWTPRSPGPARRGRQLRRLDRRRRRRGARDRGAADQRARPPASCSRPPRRASARPSSILSSDYVFDGNKQPPYVESDLTGAAVGLRALEARRARRRSQVANERHMIVRSLVALRRRRAKLRRDDARARRRPARGARRLRPGRLPDLHGPPRRLDRRADRGRGVRHPPHRGRRVVLVVRLRAGDLRPVRARTAG